MVTITQGVFMTDYTNTGGYGLPYMLDPSLIRVSNITPFTYRDGLTYLEVLESMRNRDDDLITAINTGLANLANDYNERIKALIADVAKQMGEYADLPSVIDQGLSDINNDLDERFRILANDINALVRRKLASNDIDVFNWLRGDVTSLEQNIIDQHNRYPVHGFLAGDFSRMGLTAEQIDDLGFSISFMETEGKYATEYLSPFWAYSPKDGIKKEIWRVIYDVYETTLTGKGNIAAFSLSEFDTMPMSDVDNSLAA